MEFATDITTLAVEALAILVRIAIIGLGGWGVKHLLPWLKEQRIWIIVQRFVKAAEKLGATGAIPKTTKKLYVVERLEEKGIPVTPEIDALIEAAVEDLDNATTQIFNEIKADCVAGEDPAEEEAVEYICTEEELKEMTVAQLKELAITIGATITGCRTKADFTAAILATGKVAPPTNEGADSK